MLMCNCAQCYCFSVASDLAASLQKSLKFSKCILVVATNNIIDFFDLIFLNCPVRTCLFVN